MGIMGKRGLSRFVEGLLIFLLCLAPVLMITLPWTIPLITGRHAGEPLFLYEKYLVILFLSGLLAELLLWQARGMMHNINRGRAFCKDTVRRLHVMGWESLVMGGAYGVATFFVTKFFMVVVLVTFATVGMILLVFAELFRQAVAYKEENDMTI